MESLLNRWTSPARTAPTPSEELLGDASQLRPEDRDLLLDRLSGEPHDPTLARPELLHELFERQADLHGKRTAVECDDESLTYAELETRANRLAHLLRADGVGPGGFVAILLPRSKEVYVAMLAILKTGAAYVPLDASYPADRIAYILNDCKVHAVITVSECVDRLDSQTHRTILLDKSQRELGKQSKHRLTRVDTGTTCNDLAYIIYTSGSTGRPKGVAVEHRAVCNLVRAESRIYEVVSDDRVFQGFSYAFDASIEEIWMAFFTGATLIVGTEEVVHGGPDLARFLTESRITVFSCVPTMLSMLHANLPTVRILILGGEACPAELVQRWCKPGRKMFNTYGPTEATVIATYGLCDPSKRVTIGRPLPNYRIYLLDSEMQLAPPGEIGEIHISGIGLAREYWGRPELTEKQFVPNPFVSKGAYSKLYKTGDLGRYTEDGEIEFMGRIDTQVKIRGFRIELSEIESVLMQCPEVLSAAVTVREDVPGIQRLVAYLVPRGETIDEKELRKKLKTRLPNYMVPCLIETVADLPTLPSGKVDRRRLPAPRDRKRKPTEELDRGASEIEKKLLVSWRKLFPGETVTRQSDFFLELGGHSLLAARMVSELRDDSSFQDLSVTDVYNYPTPESLAAECEERATRRRAIGVPKIQLNRSQAAKNASSLKFRLCGLAQALALYGLVGYMIVQWLIPFFVYRHAMQTGTAEIVALLISFVAATALYPVVLLISIAAKWLLIGRYKPGVYPLWGWYYFRWWLLSGIMSAASPHYLVGTPLLAIYYRLLGAKIGRNVHVGTQHFGAVDLISIGDETSIGVEANLCGYGIEEGCLKIGTVEIGKRCYVGTRAMFGLGVVMENDSSIGDLSLIPDGTRIPAGQSWAGSPARPLPRGNSSASNRHRVGRPASHGCRAFYGLLHAVGACLISMPLMVAALPEILLYYHIGGNGLWMCAAAPLAGLMFVLGFTLEIAAIKWCLLGQVRPGRYRLESWFYVRKHYVDMLLASSGELLGQLYSTLYLPPWYRLLGVRVGKNAEISTAHSVTPDMLTIDDESFIADEASLGAEYVHRGYLTILPTSIGRRTFVGNSAVVPGGTTLGDSVLLGVMSTPPSAPDQRVKDGTSWLGTPALFLPKRQSAQPVPETATYRPPRKLYFLRASIEYFRVTLPPTFAIMLGAFWFCMILKIEKAYSIVAMLLAAPLLYLFCGVCSATIVIAAKWILMGKYRPLEKPLWSTFVWRTELLTAIHERFADPFIIRKLEGTPFIAWFFRLMGAKIGSRVYMETTALTEFDLIEVGDDVALNQDCTLQTHLFEDRIMKMSHIRIGDNCTVGARAIVLYDSAMESGSRLGDLSLLMKGESLPAQTHWEGSPARRTVPQASGPH